MKFSITREALLKPLSLIAGVVERRQTSPILANALIVLEGNLLSLTGTDEEVEIIGRATLEGSGHQEGEITVPARKLLDICKSLPDNSNIEFSLNEQKVLVKSGRSRFSLASLPSSGFPNVEESNKTVEFVVTQGQIKKLIDLTGFAMAQQDVRKYLNGMLFELKNQELKLVATDGHRLALGSLQLEEEFEKEHQLIVPRKGINELARLLTSESEPITVVFGSNHVRVTAVDFTFTSKLMDGKFPDYNLAIPQGGTKTVFGAREELRAALTRTAILSNEKFRSIRVALTNGSLKMTANNPEHEEAEETIVVDYQGEALEIGFNVSYLIDVLGVLSGDSVKITLSDSNSSILLEQAEHASSIYVVMPMRL